VLIAKADQPCVHKCFPDLAQRASGESPTVPSLEVAELDHGHGSVGVTLEVAGLGNLVQFPATHRGWTDRSGSDVFVCKYLRDFTLTKRDKSARIQLNDGGIHRHNWAEDEGTSAGKTAHSRGSGGEE